MTLELILFFILAVVIIAAAIGMLLSQNAVYSALFLILVMSALAVLYLMLGAPFIAMAQITVYAGAIMVLFLFVIMLLGAERLGHSQTLAWQRPLAFFLGFVLLVETIYVFFFSGTQFTTPEAISEGFGGPASIGIVLFEQYLVPFEAVSILLLASMVGAIVLTIRHGE